MQPLAMMLIVAGFVAATSESALWHLPPHPAERTTTAAPGEPFLDVRMGDCSTEFSLKDGAGHPVAAAKISMHLRYGLMGLRRMDLAIGTGNDGRARIEGLPDGTGWLLYDINNGHTTTQVHQDLGRSCRGRYAVTLK